MKFVIENVNEKCIALLVEYLAKDMSQFFAIMNVGVDVRWVTISEIDARLMSGKTGAIQHQELRRVVHFELYSSPSFDMMQILRKYFEGTRCIFTSPDKPGFREMID
ncbi:MAG: hypothetical protein AAB726_00335 [Patescibacteria group bacterium]